MGEGHACLQPTRRQGERGGACGTALKLGTYIHTQTRAPPGRKDGFYLHHDVEDVCRSDRRAAGVGEESAQGARSCDLVGNWADSGQPLACLVMPCLAVLLSLPQMQTARSGDIAFPVVGVLCTMRICRATADTTDWRTGGAAVAGQSMSTC